MLRAESLDARCPLECSGTAGASYGCGDGANAADRNIDKLLATFPRSEVETYLRSIAAEPEARRRIEHYFGGTPRPQRVPE
jgi:hypothetical protein